MMNLQVIDCDVSKLALFDATFVAGVHFEFVAVQ